MSRTRKHPKPSPTQNRSKSQFRFLTETLHLFCWKLKHTHTQVASVVETVRVLDLELRKHCGESKMEKDKDEMDKRQISASFLEVGESIPQKCAAF